MTWSLLLPKPKKCLPTQAQNVVLKNDAMPLGAEGADQDHFSPVTGLQYMTQALITQKLPLFLKPFRGKSHLQ